MKSIILTLGLHSVKNRGENYIPPAYEDTPYTEGFGEDGDDDFINTKRFRKYRKTSKKKKIDESYWILSPKSSNALNAQFKRVNEVQLHSDQGYEAGEAVRLSSEYGEYDFIVKHNDDIRLNSVVITSNTLGLNTLTPSIVSDEGENACYQEVKVTIEKV